MIEFLLGIITHPAFPIVSGMVGFFIGNYYAIGRDKRKEFVSAGAKFREVFNQALVEMRGGKIWKEWLQCFHE